MLPGLDLAPPGLLLLLQHLEPGALPVRVAVLQQDLCAQGRVADREARVGLVPRGRDAPTLALPHPWGEGWEGGRRGRLGGGRGPLR